MSTSKRLVGKGSTSIMSFSYLGDGYALWTTHIASCKTNMLDSRRASLQNAFGPHTGSPMVELRTLPATAPISDVMAVIGQDGAVILTGMLAPEDLDTLTSELMPYLVATKPGRETFSG